MQNFIKVIGILIFYLKSPNTSYSVMICGQSTFSGQGQWQVGCVYSEPFLYTLSPGRNETHDCHMVTVSSCVYKESTVTCLRTNEQKHVTEDKSTSSLKELKYIASHIRKELKYIPSLIKKV